MSQQDDGGDRVTEFKALDQAQIEYAHELIEELHPIDDTPLCVAFPWLGCFTACGVPDMPKRRRDRENENHQLDAETGQPLLTKKTTLSINGKEIAKKSKKKKKNNMQNQKKLEEDPLASLGFGIMAYVDILWALIVLFGIFSLMLYPTLVYFHSGTGYEHVNEDLMYRETGTMGNLGYSSVQCAVMPIDVGKMSLQCPHGTIGEIYDYGLNLSDETASNCANNDDIKNCKPTSVGFLSHMQQAVGDATYNFKFGEYKDLYANGVIANECNTAPNDTRMFVQYTCIQSKEELEEKYKEMCLICAIAALIPLLFTIAIRAIYQGGKIGRIEWDVTTVTAGDYTVEIAINGEDYISWKNHNYIGPGGPKEQGVSPALALKQFMKDQIESDLGQWLAAHPEVLAGDQSSGKKQKQKLSQKDYEGVKIADIVFSFNNQELILALRARGQKIAALDFDGMRKEDKKIEQFLGSDQFDNLTIPTSAFITFESDDGKIVALNNTSEKTLLGQPLKFEDASEPTDIIWENRHFTATDYLKRTTIAVVIIGIMLFLSFLLIMYISLASAAMSAVFPQVDCTGIESSYTGDLLQRYAVDDYDFITANPDTAISSGVLQCFCQLQKTEDPDNYMTSDYGQADKEPICGKYEETIASVYYWTTALSYLLIGINYILRMVCIMLIDWIGYPTETERLSKTTNITFFVQVFNSAFLLLMINADMSEQPITFWLTGGSYGDFNGDWYRNVGNVIIGAMFFNLYYPLLESFGYYFMRGYSRCRDRGCTWSGKTTKSKSIQAYLDIYSGPIYYMHYKYSSILTISYITFMYGFGMPILFPIACASFIVLYLCERWLLFYGYKLPPMYDERLSQDVLNKLQFAPLLYCAFGYWMASNQQILSNEHLAPIVNTRDTELTNHTIWSVFKYEGWYYYQWPILMVLFILSLFFWCGSWIEKLIGKCFPSLMIGDIEINESIDNYWASLDDEDRKWSIREEENARGLLTSQLLTNDQFSRLQSIPKTKGNTLQGVHSYDILANPLYLDDFQYVTAAEDDRDNMIIDDDTQEGNDSAQSDLVRVMINLAYLTEDEARGFRFTPAGLRGIDGKKVVQHHMKKQGYSGPNQMR